MKHCYLTIDDAPSSTMIKEVDYLNSHNIQALWFCVGKNLELYKDEAIYALQKGHILGNHSYSHPHFSEITVEEGYKEIQQTDEIINKIYTLAGIKRPGKFFRFPHSDTGAQNV